MNVCIHVIASFFLGSATPEFTGPVEFLDYCPTSPPTECLFLHLEQRGIYEPAMWRAHCVNKKNQIVYKGRVQRAIET